MKTNIKSFTFGAFLAFGLGALAVNIPNTFSAGQPIKAADVNANFSSLKTAVDALETATAVPLKLTGAGSGIAGATLAAANSNGGIGAVVAQNKTGASDAALVVGQSGDGPIFKGFGKNGGNEEILIESNGTLRLLKPDLSPNIVLDNLNANISAKSYDTLSDRNRKTNFSSVDALGVLNKIAQMPIQRWNYKDDTANLQHIGPMAQDFHAAFGLNGQDNKHISLADGQGVALAAIQGLNQKLEAENAKLRNSLVALEARLTKLENK